MTGFSTEAAALPLKLLAGACHALHHFPSPVLESPP